MPFLPCIHNTFIPDVTVAGLGGSGRASIRFPASLSSANAKRMLCWTGFFVFRKVDDGFINSISMFYQTVDDVGGGWWEERRIERREDQSSRKVKIFLHSSTEQNHEPRARGEGDRCETVSWKYMHVKWMIFIEINGGLHRIKFIPWRRCVCVRSRVAQRMEQTHGASPVAVWESPVPVSV